jgi:hypothetical protein
MADPVLAFRAAFWENEARIIREIRKPSVGIG